MMQRYKFVVENGDMVDELSEAISMVVSLASGVGMLCVLMPSSRWDRATSSKT